LLAFDLLGKSFEVGAAAAAAAAAAACQII